MNHATPTSIKLKLGNPSGRPINAQEPKAMSGAPTMPDSLSPEEQVYWDQLCNELRGMGTLNTCDGAAMRLFCESAVIRDKAKDEIERYGVLVQSAQGIKKNPAITIFNEQAHTMRTLMGEFGLTPSSRTKIHADNPEADSPLLKLLKAAPHNTFDERSTTQ